MGSSFKDNDYYEAFIWDEIHGMRNLKNALVNEYRLDLNNWSLYEATAISHDGLTIVGYGKNPNGSAEAWIVTLPEPVIEADIDLDPDTLNLTSKGKWITSYIWLPQDYDVADVNSTSIMIEGEIKATQIWVDEEEQFIIEPSFE